MERRFHSPYRHWVEGLFVEFGVLSGFVLLLIALVALTVWLAG